MSTDKIKTENSAIDDASDPANKTASDGVNDSTNTTREVNGPKGPEPTRYGDWEQKGRCSDF